MINVLSIDWDFFFPDLAPFDWGHSEDRGLFYDAIWQMRAGNLDILTGDRAVDVVHPDLGLLDGFWERVCPRAPVAIALVESHSSIKGWLDGASGDFGQFCVYNFDQHHDLFYGKHYKESEDPDCGTWAGRGLHSGLIGEYHLIYPPWRKGLEEDVKTPDWARDQNYDIGFWPPEDLPDFQFVFICRSSCWTPSWADDKWIEFIEHWKTNDRLWNNKCHVPFVMEPRGLNHEKALVAADEWQKHLASIMPK